jgi:hypothetical protein
MTHLLPDDTEPARHSISRRSRLEKAAMTAVMLGGIAGLIGLGSHVNTSDPDQGMEWHAGERDLIYSEIAALFVPAKLIELAHDPSVDADMESDEAIRLCLGRRGLEKAWYLVVARGFQVNGELVEMTAYTLPYEMPAKRREFRQVLETLAGKPPRDHLVDYSTARVRIIPPGLESAEPREVIEAMPIGPTQSEPESPDSGPGAGAPPMTTPSVSDGNPTSKRRPAGLPLNEPEITGAESLIIPSPPRGRRISPKEVDPRNLDITAARG